MSITTTILESLKDNAYIMTPFRTLFRLELGEHQCVERKLIDLWISMMLLAWTSATNCARMFNISIANNDLPAWQFNLSLTSEHVFDGFTILCLLEDYLLQNRTLVVPHGV